VFDEWSTNTSSASGGSGGDRNEGESAICRRRRLMKMLRNYKSMISAGRDNTHNHQQLSGDGKTGTLVSREILAGKRRVLAQPTTDFPASRSIWTSANEEVSKFLQDPKQSQIKYIQVDKFLLQGILINNVVFGAYPSFYFADFNRFQPKSE